MSTHLPTPKCGHGVLAVLRPREDLGSGWVEAIAETCKLCEGKPTGAPFKPGAPTPAPAPAPAIEEAPAADPLEEPRRPELPQEEPEEEEAQEVEAPAPSSTPVPPASEAPARRPRPGGAWIWRMLEAFGWRLEEVEALARRRLEEAERATAANAGRLADAFARIAELERSGARDRDLRPLAERVGKLEAAELHAAGKGETLEAIAELKAITDTLATRLGELRANDKDLRGSVRSLSVDLRRELAELEGLRERDGRELGHCGGAVAGLVLRVKRLEAAAGVGGLETCAVCREVIPLDCESIGNVDRTVVVHTGCEAGLAKLRDTARALDLLKPAGPPPLTATIASDRERAELEEEEDRREEVLSLGIPMPARHGMSDSPEARAATAAGLPGWSVLPAPELGQGEEACGAAGPYPGRVCDREEGHDGPHRSSEEVEADTCFRCGIPLATSAAVTEPGVGRRHVDGSPVCKRREARRLVLLESPWREDPSPDLQRVEAWIHRRRRYASAALLDSFAQGEAAMVSHLLYTQVLDDDLPTDRLTGMHAGWSWLDAVAAVVVYADLGISDGMRAAIARAEAAGVEVETRTVSGWT